MKKISLLLALLSLLTACAYTDDPPYEITTEIYTSPVINPDDIISIRYPRIHWPGNEDKEEIINKLLLSDLAESYLGSFSRGTTGDEVFDRDMDYIIMMQTSEILSVLYAGESYLYTGNPDPRSDYRHYDDIYAITIDIENEKKLKLSDFVEVDDSQYTLSRRIRQTKEIYHPLNLYNPDMYDVSLIDWEGIFDSMSFDPYVSPSSIDKGEYNYAFCVTPDSFYVSFYTTYNTYFLVKPLDEAELAPFEPAAN